MTDFLAIIPARYDSTRFPGKPLAEIGGLPMIVRTCMQVAKATDKLLVATDDERIYKVVTDHGFQAVMTPKDCPSGTDRVWQAFLASDFAKEDVQVIVNVQGDEPFIHPEQIMELASLFEDSSVELGTLIRKFNPEDGFEALFNPNLVKVVADDNGDALYFSRSIIPYVRKYEWKEWLQHAVFHTHVGIYAYRPETLRKITSLPQSSLEKAESLEQLRWLQNGLKIRTTVTNYATIGIDTPQDLEEANAKFAKN